MSCYRKQKVLRIAADRVGILSREAYDRFEEEYPGDLDYAVGHMACSLANSGDRLYFDYWLYDRDMPGLCALDAYAWSRVLTSMERRKYAAAFRRLFPNVDMDDVRYCEYVWYDGIEAPECLERDRGDADEL